MELFSIALSLVFVLVCTYAFYRMLRFFATDNANYSYKTEKDANGNEYDVVVDLNSNTNEKE